MGLLRAFSSSQVNKPHEREWPTIFPPEVMTKLKTTFANLANQQWLGLTISSCDS
jgi:hypothetical protein